MELTPPRIIKEPRPQSSNISKKSSRPSSVFKLHSIVFLDTFTEKELASYATKHQSVAGSPEKVDESTFEAAAQGLAAVDPAWQEALIYLERLRLMDIQPSENTEERKTSKKSKTLRKEIEKIRRSRGNNVTFNDL